jgi:predicted kinase
MKPTAHLLHGYIGSGKTTLARRLERELPAIRFTHDEWMVRLYGQNPPQERFSGYLARIDDLIWRQAEKVLRTGCDVILDCGFWTRESRDNARHRVRAAGGAPKFYSVVCPEGVMRERTLARSRCPPKDSMWIDAAAFESLQAGFEAMQDDEDHVCIDGNS